MAKEKQYSVIVDDMEPVEFQLYDEAHALWTQQIEDGGSFETSVQLVETGEWVNKVLGKAVHGVKIVKRPRKRRGKKE
jgi:hypothetical protein